jgi:hypothetical protein
MPLTYRNDSVSCGFSSKKCSSAITGSSSATAFPCPTGPGDGPPAKSASAALSVPKVIYCVRGAMTPPCGTLSRAMRLPSTICYGRFQPSFDVEKYPRAIRVLADRSHEQRRTDAIEEALDIQIQHPRITPASLPRHADRIERPTCWAGSHTSPGGSWAPPMARGTV